MHGKTSRVDGELSAYHGVSALKFGVRPPQPQPATGNSLPPSTSEDNSIVPYPVLAVLRLPRAMENWFQREDGLPAMPALPIFHIT